MDLSKLHAINRELEDKIANNDIKGNNSESNKKLTELVEFAKQFNNSIVITHDDLEKISRKFKYSKDVIEDLKQTYLNNIRNNVQKALARSLAQYSIHVEFDHIKPLKSLNNDLDDDNLLKKENEKIIGTYDNFLTKLVNDFKNIDDIKDYLKIALLNSPLNPFKDQSDIKPIDRPVNLDLIDRQVKLTEAEIKKTIEREKEADFQREHQGAQISGPSL